ncbi:hypothetical protein C8R47DRAFT_1005702 [Mycena vitilis]|nr:hypothetical protein C8R47DRAFT_1005702 [Mycena vitilis]
MSSPFASKLGTNYCPSDGELSQLSALLSEPCQWLKRLDDEIATMQKAIDKLAAERDELNSYVEAHRALTSPIRRLPLDIMEAIFMACLPTNRNCVMSAEEAPVILGRICSSWRAISFSTPRLWARLHIVEPTHTYNCTLAIFEAKVAQRLEVAAAWLRRSGACPLSISLDACSEDMTVSGSSPRNGSPFVNVLLPFASQWQDIQLVAPPTTIEALLSRVAEGDVPLLRSLNIIDPPGYPHLLIAPSDDSSHWGLPQSGVSCGPSLSSFSIQGYQPNALQLPLRWAQLTVLSVMDTAPLGGAQVLELLSRCPKLQTCKLPIQDSAEGLLADMRVECASMHSLQLRCSHIAPGSLLRRLSLPSLQKLELYGAADPQTHSELIVNSLVSFLASSMRLECIEIDACLFSKSLLIQVLRGLPPTLRRLRVWEPMHFSEEALVDDDFMATLTSSPAILCPVLQEVVIPCGRNMSDDALLRFILSRVPILRLIEIKFDRPMQPDFDILSSLQPSVEAGLQAKLHYIRYPPPKFSPWQGLVDGPASHEPHAP